MLGAAAPKEMVILVSEGGDSFELEKSIANQSQLVATLTSEPGARPPPPRAKLARTIPTRARAPLSAPLLTRPPPLPSLRR